ncbi:MAG TPA: WD40 repeat domain-containing protein, partial [Candidatus Angelobacter sp.]|nr:WD40 repeat domain-containing protein [Candidatus Angelobacter sp.]
PGPGQQDLRGWEWRYLWQFCQSDASFTLCQRTNAIVSVSFSADGSLLAVGTWGSEITVWDIATRSMIFHRQTQPGGTGKLAFARTGNILAYCDAVNQGRYVQLWDSRTRMETHRLPLNEGLRDLAFTQDGRLFTCEWNGSNTVAVWDVKSGSNLARFTARAPAYAMGTVFSATEDGTRFAHVVAGEPRRVRIASTDGSSDSSFPVSDELTTAVALSKNGRTLITGGGYAEGAVKLWDVATGHLAGKLDGHRSWVSCLKLLPDGKTLASASADRTVRLWDLATREPVRTLRGQGGELWSIDVSADGRWLAGGSKDGSVVFWDLSSSTNRPPAYRTLRRAGTWWGASYSPDGKWFVLLQGGKLILYDANTLQPAIEPAFAISNIVSFVLSPDMRLLVAIDTKARSKVLEMPGQRVITNLDVDSHVISAITPVFLSGGRNLLAYGTDHMYRLWDVATWREIRSWEMDADKNFRAVSPETGLIAAANGRGWIQLIPAQDPEHSRQFRGEDRLIGVDLSPDGKTLAAASENGTVELWNTEAATRVALLHGVLLGYHSVAISPDGERVAAGSNGQEAIKIWDLQSHEEVATLSGQGSFFSDLKFSPDGNTISARNWNSVIHFWTAPAWPEIQEAEKKRRSN